MPNQPAILGVRLTDTTQRATIEKEMTALAQRHGLELVRMDSSVQGEIIEVKRKAETATADINLLHAIVFDMRGPVSVIDGGIEFLLERFSQEDEETNHILQIVHQAAKRLTGFMLSYADIVQTEIRKRFEET
jgi:signal transduction histidine kinase